jgi:hypothetical protein
MAAFDSMAAAPVNETMQRARARDSKLTYSEAASYAATVDPKLIHEPGCYRVYCRNGLPVGCARVCYCNGGLWTFMVDPCLLSVCFCVSCASCWGWSGWGCDHTVGNWESRDDNGTENRFVLIDAERGTWAWYSGKQCCCCQPVKPSSRPCCFCEKMFASPDTVSLARG